jgi:Cadherin domain
MKCYEYSPIEVRRLKMTNNSIQVQDVNDNAPSFETSTFSFDIFENAERGAIVGRVEAVDLDRGSAASTISYTFISDWGMDTFSLDPTSGVITLSGNSLDHEVLINRQEVSLVSYIYVFYRKLLNQ